MQERAGSGSAQECSTARGEGCATKPTWGPSPLSTANGTGMRSQPHEAGTSVGDRRGGAEGL